MTGCVDPHWWRSATDIPTRALSSVLQALACPDCADNWSDLVIFQVFLPSGLRVFPRCVAVTCQPVATCVCAVESTCSEQVVGVFGELYELLTVDSNHNSLHCERLYIYSQRGKTISSVSLDEGSQNYCAHWSQSLTALTQTKKLLKDGVHGGWLRWCFSKVVH